MKKKFTIYLIVIIIIVLLFTIFMAVNNKIGFININIGNNKSAAQARVIDYTVYDFEEGKGNMVITFSDSETKISKISLNNTSSIDTDRNQVAVDYQISLNDTLVFEMINKNGVKSTSNIVINHQFIAAHIISHELIPVLTSEVGSNGKMTTLRMNASQGLSAAADRNTATYTQIYTENTSNNWISYEFNNKHYIREFIARINSEGRTYTYYLQIYNYDTETWDTVLQGEKPSGGRGDNGSTTVTAENLDYYSDKVRIFTPTGKSWGNNFYVIEFQVKGY